MKDKAIRALRWSERYTKTDMVYLASGNFWLNINRGVSVINGLVLSVAFAHLITKEAYGTYTFVLALMGLFSMPQTTGLASGVSRAIARGNNHIIFEGFRRILPWSVTGAIMLIGVSVYYWLMGNNVLAATFFVGGLTLPFSVMTGISKSFFTLKGNFDHLAKFNLWRTPLMTVILVAIGWATQSALWILIVNTLGNLAMSVLLYLKMRRTYSFEATNSKKEFFAGKFAFHMGALSIFSYLSERLDNILLWKFTGAAPVAVYTYAIAPVREIKALIENQSALAMPKFARKEFSEVRAGLLLRIKQLYFLAIPLVVIYILSAPLIFKVLFPQYTEAVWLSQLAALSMLSAPRRLLSVAISAHQRIKESYIMIVLPNMIRIALAFIFIPTLGITGAVVALLVSEIIDYVLLGILIRKPFKSEANHTTDEKI